MSALYVETSALLHWLFGQSQAKVAQDAINGADHVATSVLTFIETERALIRAEHLNKLKPNSILKLRKIIRKLKSSWVVLSLSESVQRQASQAFAVEPIRTLDALHLASAIALLAAYPDLKILSFDVRVRANASALRLLLPCA